MSSLNWQASKMESSRCQHGLNCPEQEEARTVEKQYATLILFLL